MELNTHLSQRLKENFKRKFREDEIKTQIEKRNKKISVEKLEDGTEIYHNRIFGNGVYFEVLRKDGKRHSYGEKSSIDSYWVDRNLTIGAKRVSKINGGKLSMGNNGFSAYLFELGTIIAIPLLFLPITIFIFYICINYISIGALISLVGGTLVFIELFLLGGAREFLMGQFIGVAETSKGNQKSFFTGGIRDMDVLFEMELRGYGSPCDEMSAKLLTMEYYRKNKILGFWNPTLEEYRKLESTYKVLRVSDTIECGERRNRYKMVGNYESRSRPRIRGGGIIDGKYISEFVKINDFYNIFQVAVKRYFELDPKFREITPIHQDKYFFGLIKGKKEYDRGKNFTPTRVQEVAEEMKKIDDFSNRKSTDIENEAAKMVVIIDLMHTMPEKRRLDFYKDY